MAQNNMTILDEQMLPYARLLVAEVGISDDQARSLATTIFQEVAGDTKLMEAIRDSSPLDVRRRLLFFEDYQVWDSIIRPAPKYPVQHPLPPGILQRSYIEMQWVVHFYCSFIFAGDGLFEVLKRNAQAESCVRKCSEFIRENSMRALRNAVAHGNWQLDTDGSVDYWARKGEDRHEPLIKYHASFDELKFYINLARGTAWPSLLATAEWFAEGPETSTPSN